MSLRPPENALHDLRQFLAGVLPQLHGAPGDEAVRPHEDAAVFFNLSPSFPAESVSHVYSARPMSGGTYQSR